MTDQIIHHATLDFVYSIAGLNNSFVGIYTDLKEKQEAEYTKFESFLAVNKLEEDTGIKHPLPCII